MRRLKIAVLVGGPSAEHEVSLATGRVILRALNRKKYITQQVNISKNGDWPFPLDSLKADVALIAMHGTYGEDGTVQGLLEALKIPYTGSGVLASALAMDKERSFHLFRHNGLKIAKFVAIKSAHDLRDVKGVGLPCVVKPSRCGSSVGISIVRNAKELKDSVNLALGYDTTVLVQEYTKGDEVTCAVIEKNGKTIALQPTQIIPKTAEFFDYDAKYTKGGSEEITPPRLPRKTIKEIQRVALMAHEILGCRGMSRTDMIVNDEGVYVLELNTIPGMTETSLLPQAAVATGIPFPKLLDILIDSASKK